MENTLQTAEICQSKFTQFCSWDATGLLPADDVSVGALTTHIHAHTSQRGNNNDMESMIMISRYYDAL